MSQEATRISKKSKEEGKYQESLQSSMDTLWESYKSTRKRHIQKCLEVHSQGHRRVSKSGPTEATIKYQRHEGVGGGVTRGVSFHPYKGVYLRLIFEF